MSKIIKDTMSLTAITLVAGLALGGVHAITEEPIAQQQEKAKIEAYQEVFEDADSFETIELTEDLVAQLREGLDANDCTSQEIVEIMQAVDASGNALGYAFNIVSGGGYGGDIQFSVGIQNDGTVNGISILSISETAGLGMNANTDGFKSQFAGKNVAAFEVTKTGATSDEQIYAISGATITSKCMVNGVNAGICAFNIMEGGN